MKARHDGDAVPRGARALLERFCPPNVFEELIGDLEESCRSRRARDGRFRAWLGCWADSLSLFRAFTHRRGAAADHPRGFIMWDSYLKSGLRTSQRHWGYVLLNVAGLALGVACALLILLFVWEELRFDRFHAESDRIYRMVQAEPDQWDTKRQEEMSPLFAQALVDGVPEVEHVVRFLDRSPSLISRDADGADLRVYEEGFVYADSTFFDVFSFPLVHGDAATALDRPHTLVLTEAMAHKYFGGANPVGQTLLVNSVHPFEVTGVVADPSARSSLQFRFLASFASLREIPEEAGMLNSGWGVTAYPTYVLLENDAAAIVAERKIPGVLKRSTDAEHVLASRFGLEPLLDLHLYSKAGNLLGPQSDVRYVYIFSVIAFAILLIACINYMNMATARAAKRAREVGVRKVLGARRSQLARQFLGESMMTSFGAMVLALGLVLLAIPAFGRLVQRDMQAGIFAEPLFWLVILMFWAAVGLLSGSYPALLLSRFAPAEVLKGRLGGVSSGATFRRGLVVFQYTISVALVACTLIVHHQLDYMRTKKLGLDAEQMLVLPLQSSVVGKPSPVAQHTEAFRDELSRLDAVRSVAFSTAVPTQRSSRFGTQVEGSDETMFVFAYNVDPDFLSTMGIDVVEGRGFSIGMDDQSAVLVNQAAVRSFGWIEALGQTLPVRIGTADRTVMGVVRDFHFESLHASIEPVVFMPLGSRLPRYIILRLDATDLPATLQRVAAVWDRFSPEHPLDYFFLDDAFERLYQSEDRLAGLFGAFTLTAILIACLGLFGLAAFSAEQRTKEVGIRKVMGASVAHVVYLLSRDFVRLVGVAIVIAVPIAYIAMSRWLEGFAYRVDLSWRTFLFAGLVALAVALATVSFQAARAALADPVKALRYE